MSRSGYTDDNEDNFAHGRWRQAVKRSLEGKRGQALLRELVVALDAMEDKRLYPGSFATADGEFCALGVLGAKRGIKLDDLGDDDYECDPSIVGERFGIAPAMAAEIMYMNDEYAVDSWKDVDVVVCGPMQRYEIHARTIRVPNENHAWDRWLKMRDWTVKNIKPNAATASDMKAPNEQ